jgi:ribosomal protein S18 acetylase RimI-like enzyme
MTIALENVDFTDPKHEKDMLFLLDHYAKDPMGGGKPLAEDVKKNLAKALSKLPHAFAVIAYAGAEPAGLITCFEGFSTFACKPLISIHDIIVHASFRGYGISQKLLEAVEGIAHEKACCKITLEVLEGNEIAKNAYRKFGFEGYELDPQMGKAEFWEKSLKSQGS